MPTCSAITLGRGCCKFGIAPTWRSLNAAATACAVRPGAKPAGSDSALIADGRALIGAG
jgi:hypothetical protein